jgi:hypothetical protein
MTTFQLVPDYLREEKITRGRIPKNALSKALLNGSTVFIPGDRKTWGSLYTLARNHDRVAKTRRIILHKSGGVSEEGTLVWFEESAQK